MKITFEVADLSELPALRALVNRIAPDPKFAPPVIAISTDSHIRDMNMSTRTTNCLLSIDVRTIGDLINKSEWEIQSIPNMGKNGMKELQTSMIAIGLQALKK